MLRAITEDAKMLPRVTRKDNPWKINFGAKIFQAMRCRQWIVVVSMQPKV